MYNGIDASLGLEDVLRMLSAMHKHGTLQAEVSHIRGFRGRCLCLISLAHGKITSCTIERSGRDVVSVDISAIMHADRTKGPFDWSFHPVNQPGLSQSTAHLPTTPAPHYTPRPVIADYMRPVLLVRMLNFEGLIISQNERIIAGWIFSLIDGKRTVRDIALKLQRLPVTDVQRTLIMLKGMGIIDLLDR